MPYKARKTTRRKVKYPDVSWSYLNSFNTEEMLRVPEENLQACLVAYISEKYPDAIFLGNVASGVELGWKKAIRQKTQGNRKDWPDIFIANRHGGYSGCFLELKKMGTAIEKADSTPSSEHIRCQLTMLQLLRDEGYYSFMAVGWNEARAIVDWYINSRDDENVFGISRDYLIYRKENVQK